MGLLSGPSVVTSATPASESIAGTPFLVSLFLAVATSLLSHPLVHNVWTNSL